MAAPYTKAQLHTEVNSQISSQTAPESITPVILGQVLDDIIDSFWNLLDNPGLDNPNANSQGLPGEFVACVVDCALQIFRQVNPTASFVDEIIAQFPDDNANGSFDNGNHFLFTKYVTPVAGFTGKLTVSGFVFKWIGGIIGANPNAVALQLQIVKNRLTVPVVLATSNAVSWDSLSILNDTGIIYEFAAGTDLSPTILLPDDTVEVVVQSQSSNGQAGIIFQIISGLLTAQKV